MSNQNSPKRVIHVAESDRVEGIGHMFTNTPCGRALAACEVNLGRSLEYGEMADFLLDNFMEIADSNEAHEIRDSTIVVFGRTVQGKN